MKITIDTINKTITLDKSIKISEFIKFLETHNFLSEEYVITTIEEPYRLKPPPNQVIYRNSGNTNTTI